MWNLPNSLTLLRIMLVPLLVVVLLTRFEGSDFWGLGIFLLAALTDLFDGLIARKTGRITVAGTLLDPIADKILVSATFISLVEMGLAPAWMVAIIVGREFAVTGLRQIAQNQGLIVAASWWGKLKTLSQIVAISFLIISEQLGKWALLGKALLWVALAMTLCSLVTYFATLWQRVVRDQA
ncbi:MAG: CDP-diacylglycerol--glycerol-3-phosphate 3-phosphatidyltransferase [Thermoanaerobaculaceae bacterium]|nr:CDP-diacylglycerol--glycerol-3-phosphate 3-phosphatidyltransferase [Thermoanaerobaculaceae bacterium]MDI9622967.1 CDP-diacylglycerol--glycerol-3-phosphate 3-phosphatidyltransferase [Acidobacteriota bacterium]HPW54946.1 CDP-diacylglycerol--glycerol-3-phosphate 3-phosphatidyltransferase [Thermoanaerobaculaceae bacterium]